MLGAEVAGVDISDEAISSAHALSARTGVPASFERADIYDWLADAARAGRRFDAAFSSYGVVCWLPDLEAWTEVSPRHPRARRALRARGLPPGGDDVRRELEPRPRLLLRRRAAYRGRGSRRLRGRVLGWPNPRQVRRGLRGFGNHERCHLFRWGFGEVGTALAGARLRITALEEYPYSNGERLFAGMRELPGRRIVPSELAGMGENYVHRHRWSSEPWFVDSGQRALAGLRSTGVPTGTYAPSCEEEHSLEAP